jgi:hypothetical protein
MADLTSYPTATQFEAVNFKVNTPTILSETFSGKIRRVGAGVSYYTFTVKHPPMSPFEAGPYQGFVSQCFGPQLSFTIVLPRISFTKIVGTQATTAATSATVAAGVKQVNIACGAGNAGRKILRVGDFFKFNNAGHDKVYQCAAPHNDGTNEHCIADISGNATLYFSGSLVKSVPSGTALTINTVPFTVILSEDVQEFDIGAGGVTSMSLDMREVF